MDKNAIIGLVLMFALIVGYSVYISPSKEELAEKQRVADSIARVEQERIIADSLIEAASKATIVENNLAKENQELDSTAKVALLREQYGYFVNAAITENNQKVIVENDKYIIAINPKGAQIESVTMKGVRTYDSLPVVLFQKDNNDNHFGFTFFSNYIAINTYDLNFSTNEQYFADTIKVKGNDSMQLAFRLYPDEVTDEKSYIEFLYTVRGDDYLTGLDISFNNTDQYINNTQTNIELHWQEQLLQQEKSRKNELMSTTIYYSDIDDVENLKEVPDKGDSVAVTTSLKWVSLKQLFFTSTIIANDKFTNGSMVAEIPQHGNDRTLKNLRTHLVLPLEGDNPTIGMNFYFGPNKYRTLKSYNIELENQIQLGGSLISWINKWIIIPIFNLLEGKGLNYGIIILILTIIIKTILFPVTYKNFISSSKMRVVKPEIDAISQKYPKPEDAMKKQQAIMMFYRKMGIKPMAGCLPLLLQMPILIAMFRFFPSAYELRQQPFLWADDLSTYDAVVSWNTHIPIISSFYGNHISLFTLLMTIATLGYTIMNNKMMSSSTGGNEQQMKMMKWMMYLMPIMFLGIFNNYSSGLSYYYLLVNLITFIQMGIFRLAVNEDKLRNKMLARQQTVSSSNTSSKWEQRLKKMQERQKMMIEERQKNQGGLPRTKQRSNTSLTKKKKR